MIACTLSFFFLPCVAKRIKSKWYLFGLIFVLWFATSRSRMFGRKRRIVLTHLTCDLPIRRKYRSSSCRWVLHTFYRWLPLTSNFAHDMAKAPPQKGQLCLPLICVHLFFFIPLSLLEKELAAHTRANVSSGNSSIRLRRPAMPHKKCSTRVCGNGVSFGPERKEILQLLQSIVNVF